jgi:hypothetical protein
MKLKMSSRRGCKRIRIRKMKMNIKRLSVKRTVTPTTNELF